MADKNVYDVYENKVVRRSELKSYVSRTNHTFFFLPDQMTRLASPYNIRRVPNSSLDELTGIILLLN